jgi:hypothetical protein
MLNKKFLIPFSIVCLVILIQYILYRNPHKKYFKCNTIKTNSNIQKILDKYSIKKDNNDWEVYMPCGYDHSDRELEVLKNYNNQGKYIFAVRNCDKIVSKLGLYLTLIKKVGINYTKYIPKTYPTSKDGLSLLISEQNYTNTKFILKQDIQRQEGLTICQNVNEVMMKVEKDNNVIVQELLQDPFLVNGRKINLRVYLLIVIVNNKTHGYIYNDGFMYYTKELFDRTKVDADHYITTGYIDRKVYQENPLTHQDFYEWLDKNGYKSSGFLLNLYSFFKDFLKSIDGTLGGVDGAVCFQLFGCDIAPNNTMDIRLMEINKGPDLGSKDERDGAIKLGLIEDTLAIAGVIPNKPTKFTKVI